MMVSACSVGVGAGGGSNGVGVGVGTKYWFGILIKCGQNSHYFLTTLCYLPVSQLASKITIVKIANQIR